MSDATPGTPQCNAQRATGAAVATLADKVFETWPGNITFTAPQYFCPGTLAELANAIVQAERAGHHVRAFGSKWSFSDAVCATTGSPPKPGAMILTEQLNRSLQNELPQILAAGQDPTFLYYFEAGMKCKDLLFELDGRGQALNAGGASGQSFAGLMSTSTHSAESLVSPLVDEVCAINLVGAGGVEYWVERDAGITDRAKLQNFYPCLAPGNIHYNTELFNAVLVSAGSMGVIYSVILKTVPQYGLHQSRVATTWEELLMADPNLARALNGSYVESKNHQIDILGSQRIMSGPFTPNCFTQIVINPYPLYANDDSRTPQERLRPVGEHLCFVTNHVKVPTPAPGLAPPAVANDQFLKDTAEGMGKAARTALGGGLAGIDADARFLELKNRLAAETDLFQQAVGLVDFLAGHYAPGTISAAIHFFLQKILPVQDVTAASHKLTEVMVWGGEIKSVCVEAAFSVRGALDFMPKVFKLVEDYAQRNKPGRVGGSYIGGYLSLRFVGKKTEALLGMQRWSPTCCVEYLGLSGTRDVGEFIDDLQKLAIASGGILHWGLQNNVLTATDVLNAYGPASVEAFRRARGVFSQNGSVTTFDNTFTDRLGLSALDDTPAEHISGPVKRQARGIALVRQTPGWASIPLASAKNDGSWDVTNGAAVQFADLAQQPGVRLVAGDFDNSGRTGIALVRQTAGWASIPIAFSNGDGTWNITNGAAVQFADLAQQPGVRLVAGNFDDSGRTGIALVRQTPGWASIPIAFAKGDGTWNITNGAAVQFADLAQQPGVRLVAGNFDDSGRTGIALLRQTPGWESIPIAFAKGDGTWNITNGPASAFAGWAREPGVTAVVGDFNGNGRTDLALVRQTPGWGSIPVAFSNSDGTWNITNGPASEFADLARQPGVRLVAGNFDDSGRTGIALVRQTPGWASIPIAFSKGDGTWNITNGAAPDFIGNWAQASGVRVVPGDFNGDGRTDIALMRQTPGWASIPIAFSRGDGTWNISNGAAPDFIGNAQAPGVRVVPGRFR